MMWEAIGGLAMITAGIAAAVVAAYRAGGSSSRTQIRELKALVQLWQGRAERAQAGRHRKPADVQVRTKTALPPWTPTLTVVRIPQPAPDPSPDTIAMSAVTTGGMRALTDQYIAELEAAGAVYRDGLTAS